MDKLGVFHTDQTSMCLDPHVYLNFIPNNRIINHHYLFLFYTGQNQSSP